MKIALLSSEDVRRPAENFYQWKVYSRKRILNKNELGPEISGSPSAVKVAKPPELLANRAAGWQLGSRIVVAGRIGSLKKTLDFSSESDPESNIVLLTSLICLSR